MWRFVGSRLLQAIPVLVVVITATFFLVRVAPGGPFASEKAVIPEVRAALEAQYRLNLTLWQQYTAYLGDLSRGDLGPSFKYPNRTVNEIIADKLPVSLELGGLSLGIALVLGLTLGVLAAVRRNSWLDYLASSIGLLGICIPTLVSSRVSSRVGSRGYFASVLISIGAIILGSIGSPSMGHRHVS